MYFVVNKWIRFGLLFIIYRRRNIVVCFGTRHISISAVLGQNVFLSLCSVSSLFRLNLCDICMAFIFVPAILSFYAYILHPVTVGFSLCTFPVVSFKWNISDTASSDEAVAFFPIYYLNYMTCVRRQIYAVNHWNSSALPLCINYGCYLDFFEDPPRYDCADWRSSCFHFICLYSLLNMRFSVSVIPGFGVLFHSMSWQISLFVFRRFLCWFLDSWRI